MSKPSSIQFCGVVDVFWKLCPSGAPSVRVSSSPQEQVLFSTFAIVQVDSVLLSMHSIHGYGMELFLGCFHHHIQQPSFQIPVLESAFPAINPSFPLFTPLHWQPMYIVCVQTQKTITNMTSTMASLFCIHPVSYLIRIHAIFIPPFKLCVKYKSKLLLKKPNSPFKMEILDIFGIILMFFSKTKSIKIDVNKRWFKPSTNRQAIIGIRHIRQRVA